MEATLTKKQQLEIVREKLARPDISNKESIQLLKLARRLTGRKRKRNKAKAAEPTKQAHPESWLNDNHRRVLAGMPESEQEIWKEVWRIEAEEREKRIQANRDSVPPREAMPGPAPIERVVDEVLDMDPMPSLRPARPDVDIN
jgi:hypothetical protein